MEYKYNVVSKQAQSSAQDLVTTARLVRLNVHDDSFDIQVGKFKRFLEQNWASASLQRTEVVDPVRWPSG
jgi:hypothetical protein